MGIELTVLGAGREVGRAAVLLSGADGRTNIMLDYGVSFDEDDKPLLPLTVPPSKITAILITHAHLDHIGAAPFLYTSARPMAAMSRLTLEIGRLMIEDMLRLSGYYLPFEYPELITMLENTKTVGLGESFWINNIYVDVLNSGHIPGAFMYRLVSGERSVAYTGDVNTIDTRLSRRLSTDGVEANILIMESTYGMYDHPSRQRVEDLFIETVRSVVEDGGIALVPAFSLARSQEILALLVERLPHSNVYYDGMAKEILDLFLKHREFISRYDLLEKVKNTFTPVRSSEMRKRICREPGSIVVTPAGMLKGGPVQYYIKRLWNDEKNTIILVSYQAPTTPGRRLLMLGSLEDGGPRVRAKIYWFDFSSHAGATDLFNLVKSVKNLEKVVLVHGGEDSIYTLGYRIREELGVDFIAPKNGEKLSL
ncbi:MAG: MBL fold metallo-hydrolase [Ignisphaera sp.]|nr:MBL fold metallo-hydrolase [Ignisphaera sp.]MCX8167465.1 MBL fold metallo-hydrolase [Ignisphaera sp.]MDW8084671.1 MBL fold metallo-hydrolase [Ignisphaera sp.]